MLFERFLDFLVLSADGGGDDHDDELELVDVCYYCCCGVGVLCVEGEARVCWACYVGEA